jgi:hypothetical protein
MSTTEQTSQTTAIIPIQLLNGAFSAQTAASVPSRGSVEFSVEAEAGQKMIVNLFGQTAGLFLGGTVSFPGGGQTGGPGGVIMSQVLAASGEYVIRVSTSNMHSGEGGDFVVETIVLPAWLNFRD